MNGRERPFLLRGELMVDEGWQDGTGEEAFGRRSIFAADVRHFSRDGWFRCLFLSLRTEVVNPGSKWVGKVFTQSVPVTVLSRGDQRFLTASLIFARFFGIIDGVQMNPFITTKY